ncbi:MAG: tetratricopeptide repeat protein [Isosphaeraceae bacterium]|nr:tetratricopeptide repeat protein [Isosphaeraceae bacterium]
MLRRGFVRGAVLAVVLAGPAAVRADEDMRTAAQFLAGLRERGYFDLAGEYLELLRNDKSTPEEIRSTIDYDKGQLLVDEAAKTGDLVRRKDLLDQARGDIATFVQKHPKHPRASEAAVALARLYVERGHLALLTAGELDPVKDKDEKAVKLKEARDSFDAARVAYTKAETQLEAEFKTFPNYLPDNDPRKDQKDKVHGDLMDAQLQKAIDDYEQGETYDLKSKERTEFMTRALAQFEEVYKKYRTQLAGLAARMWQGKCYEEDGELGKALGIYKELLEHGDPRLRGLQRHVAYFKIIAERKREQYALAADDCNRWLTRYNSPAERRSLEGIGVQLEKAKNILAQLPTALNDAEKKQMIDAAVDALREVVRVSSPHKSEAVALLKQYKPNAARGLEDIAKMNYDDAMAAADQAISAQEWDQAVACLKQGVRKADPAKEPDKANTARYMMAFCYFKNKRYYEAVAICDHLARRYPQFSMSAKATEIAMASLADAYNAFVDYDRQADLNNLMAMAEFTEEAFPDTDPGDTARMILGQVHAGMGNYERAIKEYESVRPKAGSKWVEAQTKVGSSRWDLSQELRRKGTPDAEKKADAEVQKALNNLQVALKARQDSGTAVTDGGYVNNACDMADIYLDTAKGDEALKLLDPITKEQKPADTQPYKRLMADMLRAHVATDKVDLAMQDMASLEKVGGGGLAQLYFGLGKLLEKEMDALKQKGDTAGFAKTQQNYLKFLRALAGSTSGQTYESLEWAGENMLKLGEAKEASEIFKDKILDKLKDLPADKVYRTNLKLANALREQRQWDEASKLVDQLLKDYPKAIEPRFELGMLKEAKAGAKVDKWDVARAQWNQLALQLQNQRPKPAEYFEAWYHAGYCYFKGGDSAKALQTLKVTMKLSPSVGSPEMKKKYQDLIAQIQRESKQLAR